MKVPSEQTSPVKADPSPAPAEVAKPQVSAT
jgi:hypothetical protein